MRKKRARPADARPTRGSVDSAADLRDLDREITRKLSEIRATKAAAREARLQAGAGAADGASSMSSDHPSDAPSSGPSRGGDGPAVTGESELGLAALLRIRGAPLVEALERHSPGAREHAEATASYTFATAVEVGFDRARSDDAREAAMLHEAGQVHVPAEVLAKAAIERDEAETEAFEAHYEAAYGLARGAGIPEHVCGWLLRVRERYDGAGPEGLAGERVPLEARLIKAACACQTAMVAPGADVPDRRAIDVLRAAAGSELDPRVTAALIGVLERAARG